MNNKIIHIILSYLLNWYVNGHVTLGQLIPQFKLYIMKGCLVTNFHKILESTYNSKRKGRLEGIYYNVTTNIIKIAIWLTMPKLKNQNNTHRKLKPKQNYKTKINIDKMFCYLFPHLITSDAELVLGCVNVFGGLQSLCSFVLINLQGNFGLFCSPCTKSSSWSHGMIAILVFL
jgi:hypothetical protein